MYNIHIQWSPLVAIGDSPKPFTEMKWNEMKNDMNRQAHWFKMKNSNSCHRKIPIQSINQSIIPICSFYCFNTMGYFSNQRPQFEIKFWISVYFHRFVSGRAIVFNTKLQLFWAMGKCWIVFSVFLHKIDCSERQ